MFALVDVNSFYASCETAFRPDLAGKPGGSRLALAPRIT